MESGVGAEGEPRNGLADLVANLHHDHHAFKSLEAPVAPALPATEAPSATSPVENATQSVDDVLELVVQDVVALIPAERSVLFAYDKSANQLKPQFVSTRSKNSEQGAAATLSTDQDGVSGSTANRNSSSVSNSLGFPPVMGMVSACFLHKRCLRMQEPHPVRLCKSEAGILLGFPQLIVVNMNALCCPASRFPSRLRRAERHKRGLDPLRADHPAPPRDRRHSDSLVSITMRKLINRIDHDGLVFGDDQASSLYAAANHAGSRPPAHSEDDREIKLRRLKTVKAHARIGFSSKDEQKLIQFASHVAQVVESKLKQAAGSETETQAALRDEHAKSALELLSMLNEKLDYQSNGRAAILMSTPMPIRKKATVEQELPVFAFEIPEDPPTPPPSSPMFVLEIDPLLVALAIVKVQAMFRGRRVRRTEQFAEALEKFRLQKQWLRSAILIQRLARGSLVRTRHKAQRQAVHLLSRAYNKFKFRSEIEVHLERRRTERQLIARKATTTAPSLPSKAKPQFFKRLDVVPQDIEKFRGGVKSVSALQKRFRDKQSQKAAERESSARLNRLIKLQSFLRGSLVRKQVKELVARAAQTPTVVCLRIASTPSPNQVCDRCCRDHRGRKDPSDKWTCCVYAMPEGVAKAAHLSHKRGFAARHRLEESYAHARNQVAGENRATQAWDWETPSPRTRQHRHPNHHRQVPSPISDPNHDHYTFGVELRRLTPSSNSAMIHESTNGSPRADLDAGTLNIPTHRLSRVFPAFAFDPTWKKGKQSPAGVEYVSELSPRRHNPQAPAMNGLRSKTQQQHRQQTRHLEANESNSFRRQAFYATVGISRSELRDSNSPTLPKLRGPSRQQQQQLQRAESLRDRSPDPQALLCCLLPAANTAQSTQRAQRNSRLSLSLGQSFPKRPSTTSAVAGSSTDEAAGPSAFASSWCQA